MSYTVGDVGIVSGQITYPARGTWHAELEINTPVSTGGAQTVSLPGVDLVGYVVGGGVSAQRQTLRLVGGAGGLSRSVAGQAFYRARVRDVVGYLLRGAGETLATDSDSAILGQTLDHWTTRTGSAGAGLDALCEYLQTTWWVKPDGTVRLGAQSWQTVEPEHTLIGEDLAAGTMTVVTPDATFLPGTSFLGKRIGAVDIHIEPDKARTVLHWGTTGSPLTEELRVFVRHTQERSLPAYLGRVVTMNSDGTVDVEPVGKAARDEVGPGWQHVPLALQGLFAVKVQAQSKCIVEFLDNDVTQPVVRQFMPGTVFTSAEMEEGAEAARKGDGVGWLIVTTAPVGLAGATVVVSAVWSNTDPGVVTPPVVKIPISITGGSSVVKKVK